jgi:hypothetical protein|uniref:hypothetical protein n=1 Tax=Tenuicylindrus belgicus TaxID=1398096 RepID=UPI00223828FF|nr:hypothetical protein ON818_pgp085 [Tenuicylindrus belgicus]UYC31568.1 hypothetical protein [Tenuicylindrus belgicus]
MSHFSYIKTQIKNLTYLEKALHQLNISYTKKSQINIGNSAELTSSTLVFTNLQNETEFGIRRVNEKYELTVDEQFWGYSSPIEIFTAKLMQAYAKETVLGESKKQGFQLIPESKTTNSSDTLVFERWKEN